MSNAFRAKFNEKLHELMSKKDSPTFLLTKEKYQWIIERLHTLTTTIMKKNSTDYRLMNRYEAISVPGTTAKKLQKVGTEFLYVCNEDLFDVIQTIHSMTGHGARDVMNAHVKKKYANVTKQVLQLFTDLCDHCHEKKRNKVPKTTKKSKVVPAIVPPTVVLPRCQLDVVEVQMTPNEDAHYILSYLDGTTKYTCLKVVESALAEDIAAQLIHIFSILGAPCIIESYNGREFARKLARGVRKVWPKCVLVHGKTSEKRILDADVVGILNRWMQENETSKWMDGIPYVQWEKNNTVNLETKKTPHVAMFNSQPTLGLHSFNLPEYVIEAVDREEDLEEFVRISADGNIKIKQEDPLQVAPEPAPVPREFLVHQLHKLHNAAVEETSGGQSNNINMVSGPHSISSDTSDDDGEESGPDSDSGSLCGDEVHSAAMRDYLPPQSLLPARLISLQDSFRMANMMSANMMMSTGPGQSVAQSSSSENGENG